MIYDIYAVGNTLRSIRNKYGYTQNDMAERDVYKRQPENSSMPF